MGRTTPTITMVLQFEEDKWRSFRRALRLEDQEAYDALWRLALYHAAAAAMARRAMPYEAALMAMLVGLEREVMDLKWKVERNPQGEKFDGKGEAGGLGL